MFMDIYFVGNFVYRDGFTIFARNSGSRVLVFPVVIWKLRLGLPKEIITRIITMEVGLQLKAAAEAGIATVGLGYDVAEDLRMKYYKGKSAESRLISIYDEQNRRRTTAARPLSKLQQLLNLYQNRLIVIKVKGCDSAHIFSLSSRVIGLTIEAKLPVLDCDDLSKRSSPLNYNSEASK
ncbi:hypothetical protein L6452_14281 [Arctium lappa]|uniref:Uncharacterized protein n=1 Tax=Arctium lappa TaxID=4217 RepID=A0ACB9CKZ4_ARCLA|nr:hypothetical protein L6452_14281 [Arctium lappa]